MTPPLLAELLRRPSQAAGDMTRRGMVIGFAIGLVAWLLAVAIDRL